MEPEPNQSLRIIFLSHQGFVADSTTNEGKAKDDSLRAFIKNNNINVMLLAENNVHWKSVTPRERLEERTSTWFDALHMSNAYYKDFQLDGKQQFGGCSAWCINETAYRVIRSGADETGLGRWAWCLLRGRNSIQLRVIAAYRPVLSQQGATTVWNQQHTYFLEKGEEKCPRLLFNEHLTTAIKSWIDNGEQIVLGIDYNDKLDGKSDLEKRLSELGIMNAIQKNHQLPTPPTRTPGKNTIDSIFCSNTLLASKCGYLPFQSNYDHRPTWIDVPYTLALGHKMPPVVRPQMRRLQLSNKASKERYLRLYWKFIQQHNLATKAEELFNELPKPIEFGLQVCPFSDQQKAVYDKLDDSRVKGMLLAEKKCRKLRTGQHDWSPQYQSLRHRYQYWKKTSDQLSGKRVSKHYLMRLAKLANIDYQQQCTLQEAIKERSESYKALKAFHPNSPQARKEFSDQQVKKAIEAGRIQEAKEIQERWKQEQQRKTSRILKRLMGKFNKGGLAFVVAPDQNGDRKEMRSKEEIERACLEENNKRFRQASGTPFLTSPLFEEIGPLGMGPTADAILHGEYTPPDNIDPYAAQLIQQLAMPLQVQQAEPMDVGLNVEQYKEGWAKAKRTHHREDRVCILDTAKPELNTLESVNSMRLWPLFRIKPDIHLPGGEKKLASCSKKRKTNTMWNRLAQSC